ncbi:hypothetical protein EDB85DRAFT_1933991 [Lactarius pseudohatsudake]|nr:hypothetical protein EDB85DRAFT_1933991 [Lactarius pseudohatsudake]
MKLGLIQLWLPLSCLRLPPPKDGASDFLIGYGTKCDCRWAVRVRLQTPNARMAQINLTVLEGCIPLLSRTVISVVTRHGACLLLRLVVLSGRCDSLTETSLRKVVS